MCARCNDMEKCDESNNKSRIVIIYRPVLNAYLTKLEFSPTTYNPLHNVLSELLHNQYISSLFILLKDICQESNMPKIV